MQAGLTAINLNDDVLVRIRPEGIEILRDYHARTQWPRAPWKFVPPKADANGYSQMQLWRVMRDFGPHMINFWTPLDTEMFLCEPFE